MRKTILTLFAAVLFFSAAMVGAASANEGAWVNHWEIDYHGYNNWGNPCTNEEVVIETLVHVEGTFVVDPVGEHHGTSQSNLIWGYDSNGWEAVRYLVNSSSSGTADPSDGGHFLWQMHLTMEDPDTGQRYIAVFNVQAVANANGEFMLETLPYQSDAQNICLGPA